MCGSNIGDDANARMRKFTELADFARVIGSHLQHGIPMRWFEAAQRKWQTEGIVVVAPRAKCWRLGAEDIRQRLFAGRFAGCPRDSNHLGLPAGQNMATILAEGHTSIWHNEQGSASCRKVRQDIRPGCAYRFEPVAF